MKALKSFVVLLVKGLIDGLWAGSVFFAAVLVVVGLILCPLGSGGLAVALILAVLCGIYGFVVGFHNGFRPLKDKKGML